MLYIHKESIAGRYLEIRFQSEEETVKTHISWLGNKCQDIVEFQIITIKGLILSRQSAELSDKSDKAMFPFWRSIVYFYCLGMQKVWSK